MSCLTLEDVYDHVSGVAFKTGPPGTVGAETEWFVVDPRDPAAHVPLDRLRAVVGRGGPPPANSKITYEPGGQLELSSLPFAGPESTYHALGADIDHIRRLLAEAGLALAGSGVDPVRRPIFQLTEDRYRCMRAFFGEPGLDMMCTTASTQVCIDIGTDRAEAARRWRLAHLLGPMLIAAFANSAWQAGRRTGITCTRQVIWESLDPSRTLPVPDMVEDPAEAWMDYALDARLMLIRAEAWIADPGITFRQWMALGDGAAVAAPNIEDFAYHLSTLFPPVRPQGWLELRMIDAQPDAYWAVPLAVVAALFDDQKAADIAAEAAEPTAGRWRDAARGGMSDPAFALAARRCFDAARDALPRLGVQDGLAAIVHDYAERYVERGRCPADDQRVKEVIA